MSSIAIINGSPVNSGIYTSMRPYYRVLKHAGYDVEWYQCLDNKGQSGWMESEDKLIVGWNMPSESLRMGFNRFVTFPLKLRNVETETRFITDPTMINAIAWNSKSIVFFHDVIPLTEFGRKISSRMMFKYAINRLDRVERIIVTTNHTMELLIDMKIDRKKISIIPYTTDFSLHEAHLEKSLSKLVNRKELNVTYVAADRPHKCIDLFMEVANAASTLTKDIRFNFHLVSRLRKSTAERLNRMHPANFFLHTDVKDMETIYELTDILIHTSLYEGFGLPILEAMRFGIPIVARSSPSVTELLDGNGIIIESDRVDEWLSALDSLKEADNYVRQSTASLKRSADFNVENFRAKVINIFGTL